MRSAWLNTCTAGHDGILIMASCGAEPAYTPFLEGSKMVWAAGEKPGPSLRLSHCITHTSLNIFVPELLPATLPRVTAAVQ